MSSKTDEISRDKTDRVKFGRNPCVYPGARLTDILQMYIPKVPCGSMPAQTVATNYKYRHMKG